MTQLIRVPEKVAGIRFVGEGFPGEKTDIGYDAKRLFHQSSKGWYAWDDAAFKATKDMFFSGHLDPENGQLIIGLDEIAGSHVSHRSLRNPRIGNDWGGGNSLGGLYTLTEDDIETRIGHCYVTVGTVNHPLRPGILLSHQVAKASLMNPGDKAVCMKHAGDCFYDYQLLYEEGDDLVAVEGMDFGSYTLHGKPTDTIEIEFTLQER